MGELSVAYPLSGTKDIFHMYLIKVFNHSFENFLQVVVLHMCVCVCVCVCVFIA